MSALLPIDALELNVNAEYGYSSREFSKVPNVYVSDTYKSCLVLAYHQEKKIENRIDNYRNHFTLFRNSNSIIVVRTETSLVHTDNDAVLEYDVITPSENRTERYRSTYKNWDISFDKIQYSGKKPETFAGYTLIGSGEWWFYDNGIILNGRSGYEHNAKSQSIFIYYELHVDHKITLPSQQSLISMPPVIEVVLKFGSSENGVTTTTTTINNAHERLTAASSLSSIFQLPPPSSNNTPPPPATRSPPSPTPSDASSTRQQQPQNPFASIIAPQPPLPTFNLSSVSDNLLPSINAASRPIIRQNDTRSKFIAKDIINKSVIPSLYWFNARAVDLCNGSIEYFRPKDFVCASYVDKKFNSFTTKATTTSSSLLALPWLSGGGGVV